MSPRQLLQFLRGGVLGHLHARDFASVACYCMFLGHPRSGHTLVGSLLNAHPEVVLSHELNALRFLEKGRGPSRNQLYGMILDRDRWFQRRDARWTGYGYAVPGQWQGRFETLKVIGDKKGGGSSRQLELNPGLLERLQDLVGVPVRIVLVVRNPFDNIATMWRRNPEHTLGGEVERYFRLADSIRHTLERCPGDTAIVLSHEGFVADPAGHLGMILARLGVEAGADYLDACAGIVRAAPHRSRERIQWPAGLVQEVEGRLPGYPFLEGYRFAD